MQYSAKQLDAYSCGLRRIQNSVWLAIFGKYLLFALTGWGFVWGIWVLVLRFVRSAGEIWLIGPVLGLIPIVVVCAVLALRRMPKIAQLRALLDGYSAGGGLYMAAHELNIDSWHKSLPECRIPKVHWRAKPLVFSAFSGLFFVLLAFLIPISLVEAISGNGLDIAPVLEDITDQVKLLEQEQIVTRVEAMELRDKIDKVQKQAQAGQAGKTWESLDHLQEKLNQRASEAAMNILKQTETASKTQTLAQAMQMAGAALGSQDRTDAMDALTRMLAQKITENNSVLDKELLKRIKDALQNGECSSDDMAALCAQMNLSKAQMRQCISRMCQARLLDPAKLGTCDKLGECNGQSLAEFLIKEGMGCSDPNALTACFCCGNKPCRGGINRGRGDAQMFFGDVSSEDNIVFKEHLLPRNVMGNLKNSQNVGVSVGDPALKKKERTSSTSGALAGARDLGSSAVSQQILPQYRHTVRRYFKRQIQTGKTNGNK